MKTTKTIELSANQKKGVKSFVENKQIAQAAFREASLMIKSAEQELWAELKRIYPHVLQLNHSDKKWSVICRIDKKP